MSSNDISFYYIVGGNDTHYINLKKSINSIRKIYPRCKIIVGDFDSKLEKNYTNDLIIYKLDFVKLDKSKIYKHIIWQYKYYITQFDNSKYNLYLDSDTVLANNLDNIINEHPDKFVIAKHFYVPTVKDFKNKINLNHDGHLIINEMNLNDDMDFCAAGVFFFEKNENTENILKQTFELHNKIYQNREYIEGIYDEPILNFILQKNKKSVCYSNGALNHCSMIDMPLKIQNDRLYGKNNFDIDFQPVTCLHCDISRRDPSINFEKDIKMKIRELFNI